MEKLAATLSRHLYIIPGGYFLVQFLKKLFHQKYTDPEWRTFTFKGISLKVDVSKSMGSAIYWRGAHDWAPIFAMQKIIQKGYTVIDVGANQGEYSIWAARSVGKNGKVYAFEPLSGMYSRLLENIKLNPDFAHMITPIQMGLSNQADELDLFSSNLSNEGVNSLYAEKGSVFLEKISLNTLDDELAKLGNPKVDAIKIDVEGAELFALEGAKKTIEKYRPVLFIEINQEACRSAGYEALDILSLMEEYGYSFEVIGLRGKTSRLNPKQLPEFCNIIARKK